MNWDHIGEIARWEYLQKVRSKAFIISLVLFPVFMLAFGFLPSILMTQGPSEAKTIGVVDREGTWVPLLAAEMGSRGTLDDGEAVWNIKAYDNADGARADALSEEIEGYIEVVPESAEPVFIWKSPKLTDMQMTSAVERSIRSVVQEERVRSIGLDPETVASLTLPVEVTHTKLSEEGESESDGDMEFLISFFSGFVGVLLFMILIMTTGQTLVRGLVEEKSNRIMEILVGTTRPDELMWGKLLGLSALGLTQVFVWGLLGGAVLFFFNTSQILSPEILADVLGPMPLVLLYLILGYLFYAALFVGAGSLVTTEQEAQLVTQYITVLLAAPLAFGIIVMQDPNAGWIEVISYIPLLTPTLMMLRVVSGDPDTMTIIATLVVLLLSTVAVTWISSRIFRTAILLYGKRPSLREIMRWMRA